MVEVIPMEGAEASEYCSQKSKSSHSSTSAPPDVSSDTHTYGRHESPDDSGPPTPTHEHLSSQQREDSSHRTVFKPYAIEEPDDEPPPTVRTLELPCLPDYLERWQRELVESMGDLGSEYSKLWHLKAADSQKRGLKRKATNCIAKGDSQHSTSCQSTSKARDDAAPLHVPGLNPKRLRRRSRPLGDTGRAGQSGLVSIHDFREVQADEDSSSGLSSTGTSSPETMDESAVVEEMEID